MGMGRAVGRILRRLQAASHRLTLASHRKVQVIRRAGGAEWNVAAKEKAKPSTSVLLLGSEVPASHAAQPPLYPQQNANWAEGGEATSNTNTAQEQRGEARDRGWNDVELRELVWTSHDSYWKILYVLLLNFGCVLFHINSWKDSYRFILISDPRNLDSFSTIRTEFWEIWTFLLVKVVLYTPRIDHTTPILWVLHKRHLKVQIYRRLVTSLRLSFHCLHVLNLFYHLFLQPFLQGFFPFKFFFSVLFNHLEAALRGGVKRRV